MYPIDQIQGVQIMDVVYGFDHIRVIFLEKLKTAKLDKYALSISPLSTLIRYIKNM